MKKGGARPPQSKVKKGAARPPQSKVTEEVLVMNLLAAVPAILIMAVLVIYPLYFIAGTVRSRRQKRPGPSLVTLTLWLVVLLLIVSTVSPSFLHFASQSRQSEARTSLAAIATAQRAYHAEHGTYADTFPELKWTPEKIRHYAFFCGRDLVLNNSGELIHQRPDGNWPLPVQPMASPKHFVCLALANLDNDPFIDVWAANDVGQIENLRDDTRDYDASNRDPRITQVYILGGAFALFIVLIVVDAVRIRRGKRKGEEAPLVTPGNE